MNDKLKDPLAEVGLPNICNLLNWNHHSATQTTYPDGPFAFRYLICDQKTRRMFEGNANMAAGVAVNNAIQYFKCRVLHFKLYMAYRHWFFLFCENICLIHCNEV